MHRVQGWVTCLIACGLAALVSACAGTPRDASLPISDPSEQTNRQVLAANQAVLRPAAEVIKATVPGPVRERLRDINSNLKEPRIFLNNVLQLRLDAAAHTAGRFVVNSVFGLGGVVDIAAREGMPQESGDFGQNSIRLGCRRGALYRATLFRALDVARRGGRYR